MRYEMSLHAFDMLDQVHIGWSVRDTTLEVTHQREEALSGVLDVAGTGEDDSRQWLRDILVQVLEYL